MHTNSSVPSPQSNQQVNKLQGMYLTSNLNEVWTVDVTTIFTQYYFLFIIDLASRRIVKYSVQQHDFNSFEAAKLLKEALEHEETVVPTKNVKIVHTDSGGIFLSKDWLSVLEDYNVQPSSSNSKTNQNQVSERFNKTFKKLLREELKKRLGLETIKIKTNTRQLIGQATNYSFDNFIQLTKQLVDYYNTIKKHDHIGKLTPDEWASQARHTPGQDYLVQPCQDLVKYTPNPIIEMQDQEAINYIQKAKDYYMIVNPGSKITQIDPPLFFKEIKEIHKNYSIVPFVPLSRDDNSEKAITIRKFKHHIVIKSLRNYFEEKGISISKLDPITRKVFLELEAENKTWEKDDLRILETLMLQNQILLANSQDNLELLFDLRATCQRMADQTEYIAMTTQKNELEKYLAEQIKLKRAAAVRQPPRDCISTDDFYRVIYEFLPAVHQNSYARSRMRIGMTIMFFTGMRVSNMLALTVRDLEDLINNEFGIQIPKDKQSKSKQPEFQTIILGEEARNLLLEVFYKDFEEILRNKHKKDAVISRQGSGRPLNRVTWTNYVNDVLKVASEVLEKHLRSHSFRITFATDAVKNNVSLVDLKTMLGHKNIATTQLYVRSDIEPTRLKKIVGTASNEKAYSFKSKVYEAKERALENKENIKNRKKSKIKSFSLNDSFNKKKNNLKN